MPTWVSEEQVRAFHAQLLADHGGLPGPGPGDLEDTLARAQNLAHADAPPTLAAMAASYGSALARGHCFADGNKRVALATIDVFLQLNGFELTAPDGPEAVTIIRGLAAGEITAGDLAAWIEAHQEPTA